MPTSAPCSGTLLCRLALQFLKCAAVLPSIDYPTASSLITGVSRGSQLFYRINFKLPPNLMHIAAAKYAFGGKFVKIDVTTPTFTAGFVKRLPPMATRSSNYTHKAIRLCGYSNAHPYGDTPRWICFDRLGWQLWYLVSFHISLFMYQYLCIYSQPFSILCSISWKLSNLLPFSNFPHYRLNSRTAFQHTGPPLPPPPPPIRIPIRLRKVGKGGRKCIKKKKKRIKRN